MADFFLIFQMAEEEVLDSYIIQRLFPRGDEELTYRGQSITEHSRFTCSGCNKPFHSSTYGYSPFIYRSNINYKRRYLFLCHWCNCVLHTSDMLKRAVPETSDTSNTFFRSVIITLKEDVTCLKRVKRAQQ